MLHAQRARISSCAQQRTISALLDIRTVERDLRAAMTRGTERRRLKVGGTAGRLNALSPLGVMERGYAVARNLAGGALTSASQFVAGRQFKLLLRDGEVAARVEEREQQARS